MAEVLRELEKEIEQESRVREMVEKYDRAALESERYAERFRRPLNAWLQGRLSSDPKVRQNLYGCFHLLWLLTKNAPRYDEGAAKRVLKVA